MKLICELNDEIILGIPGHSDKEPRITVRAVIRDENGKYALIWSGGWGIYSLPGGGVEEGEDLLTALRREVLEETGCVCTEITELGIVRENRACQDYTQDNYYFAVSGKRCGEQHLTVDEARNGVKAEWYDLDEVIRRIENQNPERINCKYFRRRDMEALEAYLG